MMVIILKVDFFCFFFQKMKNRLETIQSMKWAAPRKKRVWEVLSDKACCSSEDTDNEDGPFGKSPDGRTVRKRVRKKLMYQSAELTKAKEELDSTIRRKSSIYRSRAPVRISLELSRRSVPEDAPSWARGVVPDARLSRPQVAQNMSLCEERNPTNC